MKRRPTWSPISAKADSRTTGGTSNSTPASVSAPATSIGPSSAPAGTRASRAATAAVGAIAAVSSQSRGSPSAVSPAPAATLPPPKTAISSGVSRTTISTRRYCMNATTRSSPPRSEAIVTIPDAPPAIIPSVAVGTSSGVQRASRRPAPMLIPSVAALTSVTGSQSSPSASSASDCR